MPKENPRFYTVCKPIVILGTEYLRGEVIDFEGVSGLPQQLIDGGYLKELPQEEDENEKWALET